MLTAVYTSILPAAVARGITTEKQAATMLANFTRDAERFPERPTLWPLSDRRVEAKANRCRVGAASR